MFRFRCVVLLRFYPGNSMTVYSPHKCNPRQRCRLGDHGHTHTKLDYSYRRVEFLKQSTSSTRILWCLV